MLPRRSSLRALACVTFSAVVVSGSVAAADLKTVGKNPISAPIFTDRKSTRLNSSHIPLSRMPSSA